MSAKSKAWLIDARTGNATSYCELLRRLGVQPLQLSPCFQPRDTHEALLEISKALLLDSGIALFDMDFGPREIENLGYQPEQINRVEIEKTTPQQVTLAELSRLASGASRAKIGLFTSGSTGLPKLVWQPVANLARAVKLSPRHADAVWALAYNPTHVAGIQVFLQALANSCTMVDVFGLDRAHVLAALERYKVTHLSATPSFFRLLLPIDRPIPIIRSITLGGENVDAGLIEKLSEIFPKARIHNIYASTEAGTLLVADGEVFAIAPGLEGKVVLRESRLFVHRDLLGEFSGQDPDGDWYDTGDVVEEVSVQPLRFRIVARERDWVNVGGSKVNPHEVEAIMAKHPSVKHVRVFGRKNSIMGKILCAEVVPRATVPSEVELRSFTAEHLQPFKVPRMIHFVDNIATTRTGKTSRT